MRPTTVKTPATAPVLEKNELEDDEVCALGVTVEVTNEVEVIVSTKPPDVVTSWAVVGVGLLVDPAGEDDDCVDPAPEVVGVVAEADVEGVDVVALDVVVVGAAVVAVVGVAAVVEGLGGAAVVEVGNETGTEVAIAR
jgi:hypothetical protein